MANKNKGRPQFARMTKFMLDDIDLHASDAYTGKDFSKVVNAMVRSIESQVAEKIKVDVENINGMLKASFIAPTLKKNEILKAMEATRGNLPKNITGYTDVNDNPLTYGISSSDLENVYVKKTVKGKKAKARLESNVAKMQGDVVYTSDEDKAYVRLLKDPATATPSTEEYLKKKAGKGVGALNKEEQKNRDDKKSKEEEKARKEEEREKEREEAKAKRLLLGRIGLAVMVLKGVYDVAKRILTSVMQFSIAEKAREVQEHNLNLAPGQFRRNQYLSTAMGMDKNTINEAVQAVQGKFGNITELDEKSLEKLALVMGNRVQDLIKSGMGGKNPQALTEEILNAFYQKALRGENSVGQQVGQMQARRELVSYLEKIEPNLAKMLSAMLEINSTGALAGTITNWGDVVNALTPATRFNFDETTANAVATFGQELSKASATLESFGDALKGWVAKHLGGVVDAVNNTEKGLTKAQRAEKAIEDAQKREGRLGQLTTQRGTSEAFMTQALSELGIDTSDWTSEDFASLSTFFTKGSGLGKHAKKAKDALIAYREGVATGEENPFLFGQAVNYAEISDMMKEVSKATNYKAYTFSEENLSLRIKEETEKAEAELYNKYFSGISLTDKLTGTAVSHKIPYKSLGAGQKGVVAKGLSNYIKMGGKDIGFVTRGLYGKKSKYKTQEDLLDAFAKGELDTKTEDKLLKQFWSLLLSDMPSLIPGGKSSHADAVNAVALAYAQRSADGTSADALFAKKLEEENISAHINSISNDLIKEGHKVESVTITPGYNKTNNTSFIHIRIDGRDFEGHEALLYERSISNDENSLTEETVRNARGITINTLNNTTK